MSEIDPDAALDALFESATVALALLDTDLCFVRVNALAAAINGRPAEEHVGRAVTEILPHLRDLVMPLLERVRDAGATVRDVPLPGLRTAMNASFFPIRGRRGSVRGIAVICVDALERDENAMLGRMRFEQTLAHLSARIVDATSGTIDRVIEEGLEEMGLALEADRALLLEPPREEGRPLQSSHEWFRDGLERSEIGDERAAVALPWIAGELRAGRTLIVHAPGEVPEDALAERALLSREGPATWAFVPLRLGDERFGAVALGWIGPPRQWQAHFHVRLRTMAELLVNALHRRNVERLAAERLAFETLLVAISTRLLESDPEQLEAAIDEGLRMLGVHVGADRSSIHLYDGATQSARVTYEHRAPGVAPTRPEFRVLSSTRFPWAASALGSDRELVLFDLDELPAEAGAEREGLGVGDVRSFVGIPLWLGDRLLGAISFQAVGRRGFWPQSFLARTRLVAEMFSSALHRAESEQEREERQRFDELLTEISTSMISAPADAMDEAVRASLGKLCERLGLLRALLADVSRAQGTFTITHAAGAAGAFDVGAAQSSARLEGPVLEALDNGFRVTLISEMKPSPMRDHWMRMGSAAFAALVLRPGGDPVPVLGLHSADAGFFGRAFLARLRLVQDVFAQALARREAELARRDAFDQLSRLKASVERERDYLRDELRGGHDPTGMVVASPAMRRVIEQVDAVAATTAAVLVRGETGVGKELIARTVHERSPRRDGPLVKVNCASIPRELFESEFFGHVRGSFTGAHRDRSGRFELADKGTIFLDEVGEIPIELQAKLLRVLQEGELERVGDDRTRRVDVRIVAATNRDLETDVREGRFRRDLYYRLSVFPLVVPPLRERREDVVPLARLFLQRHARQLGRAEIPLTLEDEQLLRDYEWPGNVRELAHVLERALILSARPPLRLDVALPHRSEPAPRPAAEPIVEGPARFLAGAISRAPVSEGGVRTDAERANLEAALERCNWQVGGRDGAAALLQVSPSTLRDRIRAFGLRAPTGE